MTLSGAELERYSRQLLMDDWGGQVQERCKAARAIVVGAGALGSPVATYLAAAGVGQIGLVDFDTVELSNLHRQPLFFTPDMDRPKAQVAAAKLGLLNPEVAIEPYPVELSEANAEAIVMGADVVVDCTDSFESRYTVNDACCAQAVPLVEAGVLGAMAGVIGSFQALEALKLISGVGEPLLDRIMRIDGMTSEQTIVRTSRRADCPACGDQAPREASS